MKAKRVFAKVLALALVVVMLMGMLCVTAAADQATTVADGDQDGLKMSKTVTLEDDGTYTVKLEAYATGETKIETVKQVKPADVILVLDQSGSMKSDNYKINGVPTGYKAVTTLPTNAELAEGNTEYFYKVGEEYYKVTATKEVVGKTIAWQDRTGKTYPDDDIADTISIWLGEEGDQYYYEATFNTETYAKSMLSIYHRHKTTIWGNVADIVGTRYGYVDDKSGDVLIFGSSTDMKSLRNDFNEKYAGVYDDNHDILYGFQYNNAPEEYKGNTSKENPFYVAATYIPVTKQETNTVRYTYTIDVIDGDSITTSVIGHSETGIESAINSTNVNVSPLYVRTYANDQYRIEALKYAANQFVENIRASALKNGVDHRIAIVGFGSDEYTGSTSEYYWSNTELFVGATQYNYSAGGKESTYNQLPNLAANHYGDALQSVNSAIGYTNLLASIKELDGKGATYPQYGFKMANDIFEREDAAGAYVNDERSKIIIFMTDGEPGDTSYEDSAAEATIEEAAYSKGIGGENKDEGWNATVYTVAVLSSAPTTGSDIDTYLKSVSSGEEYTLATNASALTGFFDEVDKNISSSTTSVELSKKNRVIDLFSDYFTVPEGFSVESNVTLQIAKHTGYENFDTPTAAPANVKAELLQQNGVVTGVNVTGFDFISHNDKNEGNLVGDNTSNTEAGSTVAWGNKLVITITGLLAKDEAAQNQYIDTNKAYSGIWDDDTDGNFGLLKAFNMPQTYLSKETFVLDYAKSITLTEYDFGTPKFDSAEDYIFSKVGDENTTAATAYGNVKTEDGQITYIPNTMQWDGFDSIYALTKNTEFGDYTTKNMWSKLTVIPASNVYFEDTFVSSEETGTVGIVFSGEWKEEILDGAGANVETPNNSIHGGWVDDNGLSNDTLYSDGSAHYAQITDNSQSATATFTFTGTGFDIYSRTNSTTGTILVEVKPDENLKAEGVKTQYMLIDNLAASGDYYQIPTVSYMSKHYGNYTVTLWVTSAAGERTTYYLDGIRIYNPNLTNVDDTVLDAMGDELDVVFRNLRELLLEDAGQYSEETQLDGVVFIDKMDHQDGTEGETNYVAVYEEFGPKNEIYLAKGQSIAFKVDPGKKMQIGLKAPEASEAIAVVSMMDGNEAVQQTINIAHSTDLYYDLMPDAEGNVVIRNDGEGLLSVTKIKTFRMAEDDTLTTYTTAAEMLAAVEEFESRPVVDYKTLHPTTEEEPIEPTEPAEPETPSVDINNPTEPEEDGTVAEQIRQFVSGLFNTLRGWFGRR